MCTFTHRAQYLLTIRKMVDIRYTPLELHKLIIPTFFHTQKFILGF